MLLLSFSNKTECLHTAVRMASSFNIFFINRSVGESMNILEWGFFCLHSILQLSVIPFETSKCAEKNGLFLLMSTYFFIINGRSCHKTTPESTKKPHRIIIGINRVIDFNLKKTEISGFLFQNHILCTTVKISQMSGKK